MSEPKSADEKWTTNQPKQRARGRSLFGPIILIAAGAIFLLTNLNIIPQPNWSYAFSFWPLLLIFIGLNILVVQAPSPGGTFLSLIVSLVAVGTFGYLLFAGPENDVMRSLGVSSPTALLQEEPFSVPAGSIQRADVEIDLGNQPAIITGLADSRNLIEGAIWTTSGLNLDVEGDEGAMSVKVGEESNFNWFRNPFGWLTEEGNQTWQFAVNERVPVDLRVNAGNGVVTADLGELSLSELQLDGANGALTATLPGGSYDGRIDGGNGTLRITLPEDGRQRLEIDGGNGSMSFYLQDGVDARIEFDQGNGNITVDQRFELVDGDRENGVYETAGYSGSGDGVEIELDTGNGSFRISEP
ncbi:MAG: DUF5668 domain-containing protein [Chloroflexota bacterium]